MTSQRQDRAIRLARLRNRHLTATETSINTVSSHNRHIHPKTVWNWLREFGLRACRPNGGLPLNRARRMCRMAWVTAQAPRRFPMRQWRRVFFTDESRFTLFRADGRRRLNRRRGERFADACVSERDRYGRGSVMVWGGISQLGRLVRRLQNTPNTLGQLQTALLEEWENIPMRKINTLVNSMQRRIRAVINARGDTSDTDLL